MAQYIAAELPGFSMEYMRGDVLAGKQEVYKVTVPAQIDVKTLRKRLPSCGADAPVRAGPPGPTARAGR